MVAGVRQTLGSLAYSGNVPAEDDHVTAALRAAGAVITGKTATPEFGLPCYTETRIGPPARTPWDLSRSAGGSSGGAGAAVAAGLAPAAQGSDGGGSIRIPASVCGLFGLKPTRGRISYAPIVPDLSGLSINGPLARTVADAALLLDVMAGNWPGDMYTLPPLPAGETFLGYASRDPGRLRIGRSLQHAVGGGEIHPDCVAAYEEASALLAGLGHEVEDMQMPFGPDVVPPFETLWYAMATLTPLPEADEERLLPLTRYLRERGRAVNAPMLLFAQAYLQAMARASLPVLNQYDAILSPTLALPPVPDRRPGRRRLPADPVGLGRRVSLRLAVERAGLAGHQRSRRAQRERPADRRSAAGSRQRRGHPHLAVGTTRGGQSMAGPAPGLVVSLMGRW